MHRFVLWVPPVAAPMPVLHVSHPPPAVLWREQRIVSTLQQELSPTCNILHPVARSMTTQFPDPRLIQYDCGECCSHWEVFVLLLLAFFFMKNVLTF